MTSRNGVLLKNYFFIFDIIYSLKRVKNFYHNQRLPCTHTSKFTTQMLWIFSLSLTISKKNTLIKSDLSFTGFT